MGRNNSSKEKFIQTGSSILPMITIIALLAIIILATHHLLIKPTNNTFQIIAAPNNLKGITVRTNIPYESDNSYQQLDSFVPNGYKNATPAVIFVHGGNWDAGDKTDLDEEARAVSDIGWAGFSINYRLNGFPSEQEDVLSAIEWVKNHAQEFNVNPNKIAVIGASAGGNLAAEAVTGVKIRIGKTSGVIALVSWSGPMDLRLTKYKVPRYELSIVKKYIGCNIASCPNTYALASPITHVTADNPPMLVINSTNEIVPLSQAQTMVTALQKVGVNAKLYVLPGQFHAMEYAPQAFPQSIKFLSKYLGPINGSIPVVSAESQNQEN